eukprot:6513099-Pyramimonas_sp.AAC.1
MGWWGYFLVRGLANQVESRRNTSRAATRQQEKRGKRSERAGSRSEEEPKTKLPTRWRGDPGGDQQVSAAKMARRRDHKHAE